MIQDIIKTQEFKKNISYIKTIILGRKYNHNSIMKNFPNYVLNKMFKHFIDTKSKNFFIKQDYFKSIKLFNIFKKRYFNDGLEGDIELTEETNQKLFKIFSQIINNDFNIISKDDDSIGYFINENGIYFNKYTNSLDIKNALSTYGDLPIMVNKELETIEDIDSIENETLKLVEIKIIKKTNFSIFMNINYSVKCKYCYKEILFDDIDFSNNDVDHLCPEKLNSKGLPTKVKFNKNLISPNERKKLYLYEISYKVDNEEKNKYVYLLDGNVKSGFYIGNIININLISGYNKTFEDVTLLLGVEKIKPLFDKSLLNEKDTFEWCEKNNIPFIKALVPLFSARKYYRENHDINIDDRGMLLQIMVTISAINRFIFKNRFFGISVIGDTSISKTFVSVLYSQLMDSNFTYVPKGSSISVPGLQGGINNKKIISDGKVIVSFEKGLISRDGIILFDEGQIFFDKNNFLFNEIFKEFLNNKTSIFKIGGSENVEQKYTFIVLSNFTDHHSVVYKNDVLKAYRNFLRTDRDYEKKMNDTSNIALSEYLLNINLFLPLEHYLFDLNDKHLTRAIAFVRKQFEEKDIDWKSGGKVPSANRILFDVVVDGRHSVNDLNNKNDNNLLISKLLPTENFQKTMLSYFGFEKPINIFSVDKKNVFYKRIKKLKNSVDNFLNNELLGIDILDNVKSLRDGVVDPKMFFLIKHFILSLELLQSNDSFEISDAVKIFSHRVLMKTKRGLSIEEYNFIDHDYVPFLRRNNDNDYSLSKLHAIYLEGKKNLEIDNLREASKKNNDFVNLTSNDVFSDDIIVYDDDDEEEIIFLDKVGD